MFSIQINKQRKANQNLKKKKKAKNFQKIFKKILILNFVFPDLDFFHFRISFWDYVFKLRDVILSTSSSDLDNESPEVGSRDGTPGNPWEGPSTWGTGRGRVRRMGVVLRPPETEGGWKTGLIRGIPALRRAPRRWTPPGFPGLPCLDPPGPPLTGAGDEVDKIVVYV